MAEHPRRRRVTIWDVAAQADVSHQTVSRYFRDNASLKATTRARVAAAVEELGYRPNPVARSMRTRQTGRLAVIVPQMTFSPVRILAGASATAHASGYAIDVLSIEGDAAERAARVEELAASGQVDGVLSIAPLAHWDNQLPVPVHVSAGYDDQMRGIAQLADASPIFDFVHRLAELGHTRMLHITGNLDFSSARERRDAFRNAIRRVDGLEGDVVEGDWSAECGTSVVHDLSATAHPTAIIAASDIIAAGVIRGARERGWTVPDDLSVTGWDCQPVGQFLFPALTTVEVDHQQVGEAAMTELIAMVRGEIAPGSAPTADRPLNKIIWRESTGPAPR